MRLSQLIYSKSRIELIFSIFLFFLIFVFSWPDYLYATDPTPCEPCIAGSEEQAYNNQDSTAISIGPGCLVRVFYKTRYCGGCWDIKVTRIQQISLCPPPMNIDRLVTLALGRLIFNNEMNFPPNTIDEGACWRITRPKCWRDGIASCNPTISQPMNFVGCDSTQCCTSLIFAYRNTCDNLQLRDGDEEAMYNGAGEEFTSQFDTPCHLCDGTPPIGTTITPSGRRSWIQILCFNTCDRHFLMNYLQEESKQ